MKKKQEKPKEGEVKAFGRGGKRRETKQAGIGAKV